MKERKYPTKIFILGFLIGAIINRFYLFIPSIILIIIGTKVKIYYFIGCIILLIDLIISFIWQKRIRNIVLSDSDNEDIQKFQTAFMDDNNPYDNIVNMVNEIIEEELEKEESDDKTDNE